ncbi:DNA polymerase iota [Piedraia hortae CBS 480.64]|uniref:DNA polymerase iota n=1 Tax=Piedraia hortae CBS 480.64 TaxID=1314780 RepID=A0A6A7C659_9PEZI|nr:DNA polymerase iota [Piedraia hortae CBS 480.64]
MMATKVPPKRKDDKVIIHFDYDCFYASVFEAENPALKGLPFAVQQKQIIVTCNYEARRRGLRKLQLVREAKKVCPDVVIELGEDISRFRDVSKDLYRFIQSYSWNGKVEKLGFDEVWMDVTDVVNYNMELLNQNSLPDSFFQLSPDDPTNGFAFDASSVAGHTYPANMLVVRDAPNELTLRLVLGSHLAMHIRHQLEHQKGYGSTAGITTSKLLSKLVGNQNKPKGQTTLIPSSGEFEGSNVARFMDQHEIRKVPGIGSKLARKLRAFVSGQEDGEVTVGEVRQHPKVYPEALEKLLQGQGLPRGIGIKIWDLLHGMDETEVGEAQTVPHQISIEDSYIRLDTMASVLKELNTLACSLIERMRIDLLDEHWPSENTGQRTQPRWLAQPRTIRLSTRLRPPQTAGNVIRPMNRASRSAPLPSFLLNSTESANVLAERLVNETLVHLFRRLHPPKTTWCLTLLNLAVTNMNNPSHGGRDIGSMFRLQEASVPEPHPRSSKDASNEEGDGLLPPLQEDDADDRSGGDWSEGEEEVDAAEFVRCDDCGMRMLSFAVTAHRRYHDSVSASLMET